MGSDSTPPPILQIRELSKAFGENKVLHECSLDFRQGEIHALLGGNGAGKSTLVRIVAGLLQPTSGSMSLHGLTYHPIGKKEAEQLGVEIVQQELNLISTLSVAENIYLSRLPNNLGAITWSELHRRAKIALDRVGLTDLSPNRLVGDLGVGQQQLVEIAAALDRKCKLLILDEPTAALSPAETQTLFQWLRRLRSEGVCVIYISHRLDEIRQITDRISFLRDGRYVTTVATNSVDTEEMLGWMTGEFKKRSQEVGESSSSANKVLTSDDGEMRGDEIHPLPGDKSWNARKTNLLLEVHGIGGGIVQPCSFKLHEGETVGITGLVGSGRTELLRLLFGADKARVGQLTIHVGNGSRTYSPFRSPAEAVAAGLALITEDRKASGLLLTRSILENATLASHRKRFGHRFSWAGILRRKREREYSEKATQDLSIRSTSVEQLVGTLSGGNQQKVVLAKWFGTHPRILLLDEPTRGIDLPARKKIYQSLRSLADQGKGIVIVSSDTEELWDTCDRILVMSNGQLVDDISKRDFDRERILQSSFEGYRGKQ